MHRWKGKPQNNSDNSKCGSKWDITGSNIVENTVAYNPQNLYCQTWHLTFFVCFYLIFNCHNIVLGVHSDIYAILAIYRSWIHPSIILLISPLPLLLDLFQHVSFFYFHTRSLPGFTLLPCFLISPFPHIPTPRQDLLYFPVLQFKKKSIFVCLR
jgi:hypothetical protein